MKARAGTLLRLKQIEGYVVIIKKSIYRKAITNYNALITKTSKALLFAVPVNGTIEKILQLLTEEYKLDDDSAFSYY